VRLLTTARQHASVQSPGTSTATATMAAVFLALLPGQQGAWQCPQLAAFPLIRSLM
jgi:hypothetical protein